MSRPGSLALIILALVGFFLSSTPQGYSQESPDVSQGLSPYGTYHSDGLDYVNLKTRRLNLSIPLFQDHSQRGDLNFSYNLAYSGNSWTVTGQNPQFWTSIIMGVLVGSPDIPAAKSKQYIDKSQTPYVTYRELFVRDGTGATHDYGPSTVSRTIDGSGFVINSNGIVNKNGVAFSGSAAEDVNGNKMSLGSLGPSVDTLGRSWSYTATSDVSQCPTAAVQATLWQVPGPNGTTSQFKFCTSNVPINTDFSGVPLNYNATVQLLTAVILPNGTYWRFDYNNDGDLHILTIPTGGTITYTWTLANVCQPDVWSRVLTSRTVFDGQHSQTWTYSPGKVTDPLGNDILITGANTGGICNDAVAQIQYYSGPASNGILLKTVSKQYDFVPDPYPRDVNSFPTEAYFPTVVTTSWPNGQVSQEQITYDTGYTYTDTNKYGTTHSAIYGLQTSVTDYDYGSGAPGPVLRKTTNTYMVLSGPNSTSYFANNLLDLPYTVQIQNGAGQVSLTQYKYDESPLATSGLSSNNQWSATPPAGTYRGNNTSVYRWLNSGTLTCQNGIAGGSSSYVINTKTYYDGGMLHTSSDPCKNTTTYSYSSAYWYAFPTTVTNALNQPTTHTYDFNTGLLTSTTDPNNLATSYTYDNMRRLYQKFDPDGGIDTITHQESTFPFTATLTSAINPSTNKVERNVFDGLGRVTQHQLTSDPQGTAYTDTTYDALGRVSTVSNPHRTCGTDATSSCGTTTYGYDALSRKISETYPDNSVLRTAYCGPSTLVTDPSNRWRRSRVDGLGRLVEVDEPNSTTATVNSNGCPGTGEPIWGTSYTFDALGNLTNVVQNGSHPRTFTYDSLSRLLTSLNPEVGTITYTYNPDGPVRTKTDARGITTCFGTWAGTTCGGIGYDALHREILRSYSNGDPTITYSYDRPACLGLSVCQNIGHRTGMTDAAGSEAWAFGVDKVNHPNAPNTEADQRTTNNITKTGTYYADLAKNGVQAIYPTGRVVNYTYDAADRPSKATDGSNGITYATGFQTPPSGSSCVANAVCYTPRGSVYAMSLGQSSSFTGVNFSEYSNSRLQPQEIKASSTGGNAMDISYNYVDPVNGGNAGHVFSIANNLNSSRTQNFRYDQLNRILSAGTSATSGVYCWGYQYTYDAWANLTAQADWTPNYNGCAETVMSPVTADGNNHISTFGYDGSGNATSDGSFSYLWNAESQLKSGAGVSYVYDGDGRRIEKVGSKLYWYGEGGEILVETDASGNILNEYIFFGARRIALLAWK